MHPWEKIENLSSMFNSLSNFNYKPHTESHQQHLDLFIERHLRSVAIMIELTSRHTECTYFNSDYSQMPAVALQVYSCEHGGFFQRCCPIAEKEVLVDCCRICRSEKIAMDVWSVPMPDGFENAV